MSEKILVPRIPDDHAATPDGITELRRQEALLKTGALQNAIFNSANFSSIATDANGVIQVFNVGAERMLGYTAAEVMNKITPADISDPQELIARAAALSLELDTPITPGFEALVFKASRGIEDIYERTYIRKDGSRFPAAVSVTALRDAQDAIIGYLLIGTDSTARKQADASLRQSEARLRAIIDNEPECVKVVDKDGQILEMNPAGLRMIEADSFLQAQSKGINSVIVEEHQAAFSALLRKTLQGESGILEFDIIGLKGTRRTLETHAVPLRDERGEVTAQLGITRDITEHKRAEEALQASEERFKTMFVQAPLGIALIDSLTGHIHEANPRFAEIAGRSMEEMSNIDWIQITHLDDVQADLDNMALLNAGKTNGFQMEKRYLHPDGTAVWINMAIAPLKVEDKTHPRHLCMIQDITERKEAERTIVHLNRVYAMLSGINSLIVRMRDRDDLLDEACRIAVEQGKFRLAWIGLLDANGMDVTPVARAGADEGYLDNIQLTAGDDAPDRCEMVTRALREKTAVVCNDIDTGPQMARWREEALRRGHRSVVVLPLQFADKVLGVFLLYAAEKDFFDTEEMKLLRELAGDISLALDHIQKEEQLSYFAYFDAITGLPNRTLFMDRAAQKINAARRDDKVLSVIMLNLNRFSVINETLGRQAGDDLLRQLTQRLQGILGETDILAHFSADYFGIATRCDDASVNIVHVLENILSAIQDQPFLVGGQELRISVRAGVSSYPADGEDIEALSHNAEAALKKTKISGDRYLFYAPAFNALAAEKLTLENKLRRALEQEQLVLHYQPKVNLKNGQICGLEALLRWNDPATGLVPPLQFIPLLEETGMILEAGRWALAKAVSDTLVWQSKGLVVPRIAVNVSAIQLQQKDFVDMVAQAISGAKNAAVKLELEITESLIMQDIQANILKLRAIRGLGIEVAIDDFGTGYSSLSYLAKLPVSALKIDQAFIMNMASNADDLSIVSTIISLAHSLNLRVIAECVETEEQANLLRLHKCDEIQGYLFSPAVPAEKIETFLRENKALGNPPV